MPLEKSASKPAISRNISEFHKGPSYAHTEAKFGKKDANAQAVAVAMETARKAKRAKGGRVHVGPIVSDVAGRTDHHAMSVPENSYVIPADIVSGLGEGNTAAGMRVVDRMFPLKRASGGAVKIMAAGGEIILSPDQLKAKFGGDLDHAHASMDAWVKHERQKIIQTMSQLPGPAQD